RRARRAHCRRGGPARAVRPARSWLVASGRVFGAHGSARVAEAAPALLLGRATLAFVLQRMAERAVAPGLAVAAVVGLLAGARDRLVGARASAAGQALRASGDESAGDAGRAGLAGGNARPRGGSRFGQRKAL